MIDLTYGMFLAFLGFFVGIMAGLIGVGGALLTIPAMLYVYPVVFSGHPELPMTMITSITAMQSLAAGASSARVHWKKKNIDLPVVIAMGLWSMVGGYVGGMTTHFFSDYFLKVVYAVLLTIVAYTLVKKYISLAEEREAETALESAIPPGPEIPPPPLSILHGKHVKVALVSILTGYSAGIMGIGGAVFVLPVFTQWLGLPVRMAIGSTTGVTAMTCVASVIGKVQIGGFPWVESLLLAFGALLGATLGAKLSFRVSEKHLLTIFIMVVMVTLVRVSIELFFGA